MPPRRLAIIILSASICVSLFFFVLLGATGVLSTKQHPSSHVSLIKAPESLVSVLTEEGALNNAKGEISRVLIVTMEIGFSSPGGIGTAYTGLALALVEKGHNVTILFVDDNRHTREEWITILAPLDGIFTIL